jgi:hypothetical protein
MSSPMSRVFSVMLDGTYLGGTRESEVCLASVLWLWRLMMEGFFVFPCLVSNDLHNL